MRHRAGATYQYQYVRQWSVDVAALADQLENPKAHVTTSRVTLASRQQVCNAGTDANTGTRTATSLVDYGRPME